MPPFKIFLIFINHSHSTIIHSFILHYSSRPVFLYPHRFSFSMGCRAENPTRSCLTASRRNTNWATPHPILIYLASLIDLHLTLTKLRRTLTKLRRTLNWSTPHPDWATLHKNWATPHPHWAPPYPDWAGPHPNWATPHPNWAKPHPNWATPHSNTKQLYLFTRSEIPNNPLDDHQFLSDTH